MAPPGTPPGTSRPHHSGHRIYLLCSIPNTDIATWHERKRSNPAACRSKLQSLTCWLDAVSLASNKKPSQKQGRESNGGARRAPPLKWLRAFHATHFLFRRILSALHWMASFKEKRSQQSVVRISGPPPTPPVESNGTWLSASVAFLHSSQYCCTTELF
jgi:hypothetical protein